MLTESGPKLTLSAKLGECGILTVEQADFGDFARKEG